MSGAFTVPAVALRWALRGRYPHRCGRRLAGEVGGQLIDMPVNAVTINGHVYWCAMFKRAPH